VAEEVTGGHFVGITTTSDRQEDMSKPLCTLFNVELRANGKDIADNNLYDARYHTYSFGKLNQLLDLSFLVLDSREYFVSTKGV
jgi:hypothetical protein